MCSKRKPEGRARKKQNADNSRYSAAHPFSGLIICGECGRKYRRYTRSNGQVVWRCANRVEHGSEICKESPTIPEGRLKVIVSDELVRIGKLRDSEQSDYMIPNLVDRIIIESDERMQLELRPQKVHRRDSLQRER